MRSTSDTKVVAASGKVWVTAETITMELYEAAVCSLLL